MSALDNIFSFWVATIHDEYEGTIVLDEMLARVEEAKQKVKDLFIEIVDSTGGDEYVASRKWLNNKIEEL